MVTDLKSILNTWHVQKDTQEWVLATLYKIEGSSYRKLGAMMLISSLGQRLGMLSGGCLEADIQRHAKQVMSTLTSKTISYDATDEDDLTFQLGIGCGGIVHILLQPVHKNNEYLQLDHVFTALSDNKPGQYSQQVTPVLPQGSGAFTQNDEQHDLSMNRKAKLVEINNATWLQTSIYPPPHLLIVGGGADAVPVYALAKQLGWSVSVWDTRAANAKREYFKNADAILRSPPSELKAYCEKHKVDAAILMAHSVELDASVLKQIANLPFKYIGLLGPAHRREQVLQHANTSIKSIYAPVFGPVGLNLGGDSPESIALSLISEIHAVLSNKNAQSLSNWGQEAC
ncbi:XdhC family protein [Pseudoalteromonas carrageenovora]|uniref:XdhC family protein n=1 Tax=Pseudoalteromonas TaxID=53246 RepID=UPI001B38EC11|nr:XdhC/CoxI family protein [Pseudoalteromonas sp. MMG007]MBQ4857634.1 XdhC family protein [Pseudoalteromonas sp. MMG007]